MKRTKPILLFVLAPLLWVCFFVGCGPQDPVAAVLEERAEWKVVQTAMYQRDGQVHTTLKVTDPPGAKLGTLTVKINFHAADETVIDEFWHALDVADVRGGTPVEKFVSLPDGGVDVAAVSIQLVPYPDDEQRTHLVELPSGG